MRNNALTLIIQRAEDTAVATQAMNSEQPRETAAIVQTNDLPKAERREAPPAVDRRFQMMQERIGPLARNLVLPALTFAIVLAVWSFIHTQVTEDIPSPSATWEKAVEVFSDPFYQAGPNDMGIGWQVLYSLGRVMAGFALAVLVGIPVGFIMGISDTFNKAWYPLIQILRPVSPLAWLPIGLLLFQAVNPSAIFVIFITSIWPVIINTAAGVRAIPVDYLNVARVLRLGKLEVTHRILIPATLPHMLTGMRLSLGIAWMVIVAAEMLTGGIGIGFFIWDEWNNLSVTSILVAIGLIGMVGILLEGLMNLAQKRCDYPRQ